jgi:histidinol-phosphate aminotransferase
MTFNRHLNSIKNYEPGKPIEEVARDLGFELKDIIKLASNENPYGVSLKVKQALIDNAYRAFQYPDDTMFELKGKLAHKYGVEDENIIIGSGSDQVIEFIIHAKCNENSKVLTSKTTFAMYEIYTKMVGATLIKTPSHEHKLDEFLTLYKEQKPAVIFLCTPNNPLGEALDNEEIISFLEQINSDTLVVVDGAYMEYAKYKDEKKYIDPKSIITKFENVVYTGTFSKAYALGGMRVGYAIAQKNITQNLYKLRPVEMYG